MNKKWLYGLLLVLTIVNDIPAQISASDLNTNFIQEQIDQRQQILFIEKGINVIPSLEIIKSDSYDNNKTYYAYLNNRSELDQFTFVIDNHFVDDITLFISDETGEKKTLKLNNESNAYKNYIDLLVNPGTTVLLELNVKNRPEYNIPCYIYETQKFHDITRKRSFTNGLFFGVFLLFFIYALVSLVVSRKNIYFWLMGYIVFSNIFHLGEQGVELPFIIGEKLLYVSVLAGLACLIQIGHYLLDIRKYKRQFDLGHKTLSLISIIMILMVILNIYDINITVFSLFYKALSILGLCAYLYVLMRAVYYDTTPSFYRILLISYVCLVIGFLIKPLSFLGVLDYGNMYRYSAMAGQIIELLCLTGYLIMATYAKIKRSNLVDQEVKKLERSALQAQMNPHFIFNCLNSIQNFIMENEKTKAMDYLSRFAKLIRQNLNASVKAKVSIKEEVTMLHNYLELEQLRFKNKFEFNIQVSPDIDQADAYISPLLIQPFVENAVLHGVNNENQQSSINVKIDQNENYITVIVEDNGTGIIGPEATEKVGSFGMDITGKRLKHINDYHGEGYSISTNHDNKGTKVHINIKMIM